MHVINIKTTATKNANLKKAYLENEYRYQCYSIIVESNLFFFWEVIKYSSVVNFANVSH